MYNMYMYNMHIRCKLYAYIIKKYCVLHLILKRKCRSVSCLENIIIAFSHFALKFINAMQFEKCFDFHMIPFSYRMALTWKKKSHNSAPVG